MKKSGFLTCLALAAMMTPLASCNTGVTSSSSSSSSQAVSSSSIDPVVTAGTQAIKMLNYDTQITKGLASRTVSLVTQIKYDATYTFTVTYSIVQDTAYTGASGTIEADNDPDLEKPVANMVLVAPTYLSDNKNEYVLFTLTAHLMYNGKEVLTHDYPVHVAPVQYKHIKDIGGLDSGTAIITFGYVTGKYANTKDYLWVGDGEAGITAYGPSAIFDAGTLVKITGSYSPYSGLAEFAKGCKVEAADATDPYLIDMAVTKPTVLEYTGQTLSTKDQSREIKLTGKIISKTVAGTAYPSIDDEKGRVNFYVQVGTGDTAKDILVYAEKAKMGDAAYAKFNSTSVVVDKTVTVEGWLGFYNDFQVVSPSFVS